MQRSSTHSRRCGKRSLTGMPLCPPGLNSHSGFISGPTLPSANASGRLMGRRFAVIAHQSLLRIEDVNRRRSAMHKKKDHAPGFWFKMRLLWRQRIIGLRIGGGKEPGFFGKHRRQTERTKTKPCATQPGSARHRLFNPLVERLNPREIIFLLHSSTFNQYKQTHLTTSKL